MTNLRRLGGRLIDWAGRRRTRALAKKRVLAVAAAATAMAVTAACTAGTAASGGGGGNPGKAGGSGSGNSNAYLTYSPCCSWNTTWSFNPYNVNGLDNWSHNFVVMPLAIQKYPSLTDYSPQLAESWSAKDGKLTVNLRQGAKWQDNTPVTSKDVYNTAILNATRGDGMWNDITKIDTPDDQTIVFTLKKGQPVALAENDIFGELYPFHSNVYGNFVTKQLIKDVYSYWRTEQTNPTKASKMPAFKRMSSVFKDLAAKKVSKMIGDGPFTVQNITTKEAKLPKWDGFWAADKIKFGGIDFLNGSNETIYPQLFSNRADFSNVYLPPPILKRWTNTPDSNTALPLAFGFMLGFNSHRYPLSIKQVRQALAYVIPRQQMTEAAYGTAKGAGGRWKEINTGLSPTLDNLYLTKDQLNSLNKYPVDTAKAAKLLKSVDFTQKGGQWYDPKGKRFTMTFTANSGTTDLVTSFNSAAKALTAFGIKSDVNATSGAQQDANQHNGDFQAGMYLIGGNNPLSVYDQILGPLQNYSKQGNYAGKRGLGFGPTMNVPGLGKVDVASTIDRQVRNVGPGPKMKELTWDWARLVNDQVPYIWYATKVYQFSYSTKNFTNWPPKNADGTSPLWDIIGANLPGGLVMAMEQGYITPK